MSRDQPTRPVAPAQTVVCAFGRHIHAPSAFESYEGDDTEPFEPIRGPLTWRQRVAKWWSDYRDTWRV